MFEKAQIISLIVLSIQALQCFILYFLPCSEFLLAFSRHNSVPFYPNHKLSSILSHDALLLKHSSSTNGESDSRAGPEISSVSPELLRQKLKFLHEMSD